MSKGKWPLLAAFLWLALAATGPACHAGQVASGPAAPDLSALAARARPAVAVLVTFDADGEPLSQGTAFFVRANGVALTCHHMLEDAASALVRMESGAYYPVEGKLAADPVRDLALFKVAGKGLPTVPLGDSSSLAPGQRVVAITAPEGLENTVADGLVSAVRELPSGPMVQVTVPLSTGSSGGPIFDLSGKVVAVAAAVLTEGQALNFAIPINAAKPLLAQPGKLTPLTPAERPADLEDWLRQRPTSPRDANAYDLWRRGMDAHFRLRTHEAVEALKAALALDPSLWQAYCCLGASYGLLGRYQEELEAYKEAVGLNPDSAKAQCSLGGSYSALGRYQEAIAAYKEAIRLKPDDFTASRAYSGLGGVFIYLGRWTEAVEAYKEAIRVDPYRYPLSYYYLGVAYDKLGRHQEALEVCQQGTRPKPDLAEAYVELGSAYAAFGYYQEALEAYRQATRLKPGYAEAYYRLGLTCREAERWQEALEAFKQAVRLKPDDARAYMLLGRTYGNLRRWQEALEAFKQAVRLKPDDMEARYAVADAYEGLGRRQEAIATLEEAVRVRPDLAEPHYHLGLEYAVMGRRQEAIAQYKEAIRLKPDLAEAHGSLGLAYAGLGRWQDAVVAYEEALRLNPHAFSVRLRHIFLGEAYIEVGRYKEAIETLREYLRMHPGAPRAHYLLGWAYLRHGERPAAVEQYRILKDKGSDLAEDLFKLLLLYP